MNELLTTPIPAHVVLDTTSELYTLAYSELKRLARQMRRKAHSAETLDTTALVHEAYLKIRSHTQAGDKDSGYLRALAARAMRQILVDRARRRMADKRGGGLNHLALQGASIPLGEQPFDLVSVDRALHALEALAPRLARLVELHVFAGLSMPEVANYLEITERTAFRDWRKARAFLVQQLDPVSPA